MGPWESPWSPVCSIPIAGTDRRMAQADEDLPPPRVAMLCRALEPGVASAAVPAPRFRRPTRRRAPRGDRWLVARDRRDRTGPGRLRRYQRGDPPRLALAPGHAGTTLRVVGRTSLSPRHTVHLLSIGQRVLIVGTGPQGAPSLLGELTDPDDLERLVPRRARGSRRRRHRPRPRPQVPPPRRPGAWS